MVYSVSCDVLDTKMMKSPWHHLVSHFQGSQMVGPVYLSKINLSANLCAETRCEPWTDWPRVDLCSVMNHQKPAAAIKILIRTYLLKSMGVMKSNIKLWRFVLSKFCIVSFWIRVVCDESCGGNWCISIERCCISPTKGDVIWSGWCYTPKSFVVMEQKK